MKKIMVLCSLVFIFAACNNDEAPLQASKYPCGMSFSYYSALPPRQNGNTENLIIHFVNDAKNDFTIIYTCNKNVHADSMLRRQMLAQSNTQYKKIIDGRACFKTNWEQHFENEHNIYTTRVLCANNEDIESLEIDIPLWKDNIEARKEFAEKILSTVNFK